ncbi:MAG: efflux RND transporter periplasmic adaptor subunit [Bacteroides sp.]|nr:efflux RND transporter periplasmic adaptor subunit [Bacteroides sp.]
MNRKQTATFLLILLLVTGCKGKQQHAPTGQNNRMDYPLEVVQPQNITLQSVYPAIIRGEEDIDIQSRIDGFIEAIYVDEGSVVKKGQVLFTINSPQSEQNLVTAQASVTSAQASLNTALLNVERMRPLAEKNIISTVQLETYENAYASAQTTLEQAEASVANARATLSWTQVKSPVDGIVGAIPYRQGSLVSSANTLTTVANTRNVYAYFSLNEKELLDILKERKNTASSGVSGMPAVNLILADGSTYPYKGRIETISGVVNTTTGSVNLRAEFANPQYLLRSGTSGKIVIPRIVSNTFLIPQKATFAQQDKTLVYKVQGDSVVQKIITAESTPDGQNYAVTSGLQRGDTIVTDGIATLSNGKKINVTP